MNSHITNGRGGYPARIGEKFHYEMEEIKKERIIKGTSKDKISTEKITNLIVRHKESWKQLKEDLIKINEKEIDRLCN